MGLVLGILARVGTQPDDPITGPSVTITAAPRLTGDVVARALTSIGLAGMNAKDARITFPNPITRDGPGWRADVDLPHGVTWGDVAERRDKLASGLRRNVGCVWPEGDVTQHAGRLVLWVGDQSMAEAKAPAWPLLTNGTTDVFQPIPFGHDPRMRPVEVPLIFNNALIGALPRQGKTFALRVFLLGAALDWRVRMHCWELKGTGDLDALEPIAHRYGTGPDDATIAGCVADLREVEAELAIRAKIIRSLPREVVPENKLTPELASQREGLRPVLVAVDECQELFSHKVYGAEAGDLCERIIKRGPAMGVILILATQRPDAKSLPTGVSANAGMRFCLRVMGQFENDAVLGTSMYRNGFRATMFTPRDKGVGYLAGVADEPIVVRSAYIDGPAAEKVITRATALRRAHGAITGHAAGEEPAPAINPLQVVHDVIGVWSAGAEDAWSDDLATALAAYSSTYDGWTGTDVTRALGKHGVTAKQLHRTINGKRKNKRGVVLVDVEAALNPAA